MITHMHLYLVVIKEKANAYTVMFGQYPYKGEFYAKTRDQAIKKALDYYSVSLDCMTDDLEIVSVKCANT